MIEARKNRKFGQAFNKLSYYRGALMAFNWDMQIHHFNKNLSLDDFIHKVYETSLEMGGSIKEKKLFKIAASFGIDAKKDFEKYILCGEPVEVESVAFDGRFRLKETKVPSFDPGFSITKSYQDKK